MENDAGCLFSQSQPLENTPEEETVDPAGYQVAKAELFAHTMEGDETGDRIHIFCKALRDVGKPEYIRLLINADHMRLIMQPYHKKDLLSFRVPKSIYSHQCVGNDRMELHSQAFCLLLANRLGWDTARSYRVPGIIYGDQNLVCFDLNKAAW